MLGPVLSCLRFLVSSLTLSVAWRNVGLQSGASPAQFLECRMVMLPKEGKVDASGGVAWNTCVRSVCSVLGGDFGLAPRCGFPKLLIG